MTKKIAVLGCGYWGKNLVRNFHALGALGAVVEPQAEGRRRAAEIAPDVAIHAAPEAVWSDASIGGVVIATPAAQHARVCAAALEAGKDVLCEKPLALRYEDAERVARLADQRGRILMVGHILEYHPGVRKLVELVHSGELGATCYIYSHRLNLGKVRREENILWSFAPHDIAVILRLVGDEPVSVLAAGGAYVQAGVTDVTVTQLGFASGVAAHVFVSWLNPYKEQRLVVVGSRGMATFDDVQKELKLYDQRVEVADGEPVQFKKDGVRVEYAADEPLRLECEAFLSAMTTRQAPLTDAVSALRVLRVLEAAQQSLHRNGQPVELQRRSS